MTKIALLGSTGYKAAMERYADELKTGAYGQIEIRLPVFNSHPDLSELGVIKKNRELVEWADEIHVFWDQRSPGFLFDFGMVFMARKRLRIIHLSPRTFANALKLYAKEFTL